MDTMILVAPDISCAHCQTAIERGIGGLTGVQACAVDVAAQTVTVTYDPTSVSPEQIRETLDEEGYPVAG